MAVAALVSWLVTAVLGAVMLVRWAARGGLRGSGDRSGRPTRLPPALVFGHFLLAAAGLVVWIAYLVVGGAALVWLAFGLLVLVAVLGDVMFLRWWRSRREPTPESGLPVAAVYLHGLVAVVTVVLVLLVGLGIGS
jgi:hypothetical protein